MTSRRIELRHVPALDGIRGLAVAGVLLYHGDHLTGGFLGVDLFFVLSGYLITSLLLNEWGGSGGIGLKKFWGRRARRLLPALFGLLAGIAIYSLVWAKPYELGPLRADSLSTVFYVANWHALWSGHGYWDLFTTPSPLQHTWSLAIEEQFYLVWPLVVLGVLGWLRRSQRTLFILAVVGALASSALMAVLHVPNTDPSREYFGTDTRAGAVLLGAALATFLSMRGTARGRAARVGIEVAACAGVLWLAWAWSTIDGQSPFLYRGGFFLCGVAVVAVLASASHPKVGPVATVLAIPPLRWLGLISYGLYLWHWPVFVVLKLEQPSIGLTGWPFFAVQVAVSLAFAVVSYFVLELPIRHRGLAAWPAGRYLMPAGAALAVVLLFAATMGGETRPEFAYQNASGVTDPGAAGLAPLPTVVDDTAPTTAPSTTTAPTSSTVPAAPAAKTGPIARPAGRPARLLVVGDSVGYYLGEGIKAQQGALNLSVGQRAMYKCTLGRQFGVWRRQSSVPDDPENADCRAWPKLWGDAVSTFKPDAVLFLFGGPPQGELQINGQWRAPCTAEFHDYWRQETEAAVGVLTAKGAMLYLAPSPHPRFAWLPADIDERTDCVNRVYREVAAAHPDTVRILPIDDWTCPPPGKDCVEKVDGVELREDGIHYRGQAAEIAGRWAVGQMFTP